MIGRLLRGDARRHINFILTALRLRDKGFFTPYDYGQFVDWDVAAYPAIEALFQAEEATFADLLRVMDENEHRLLASQADPAGPDWTSSFISPLDGAAIYCFLAAHKPARVIEVGSGNSTHFMARAVADHGLDTKILCIDPSPRIEVATLDITIRRRVLSIDDLDDFAALAPGDIAFIDSSHITQQGFDVDILFNRVFPILKPGVFVHVHDIFLPFGYPSDWKDYRFNEQLALFGWIVSGYFHVLFPAHYVWRRMKPQLAATCPGLGLAGEDNGGSLWMRKS